MNNLLKFILLTVTFNCISFSAQARTPTSCYMQDTSGNSIDLGYLCQKSSTSYPNSTRKVPPVIQPKTKGVQIVQIKSRRAGIPVIDVKFNNKYTFEMMLDTGASGVVITQQMAKILKVNHTESVWVSTPSSRYFKMPAGYVYSVGVGKLTQKNTHVITSPSMDIGLLGQSFFSRYDLTIKSDVIEFRER